MKIINSVLLFILILAPGYAQPATDQRLDLLVADGSSSGTYQKFLKEIAGVTGNAINLTEVVDKANPPGAIGNLDMLINNKVMAAFVHSDVLQFRAQTTDLQKFKTLLALFSEDVHFIALAESKHATGGIMGTGYGKKITEFADVSDLKAGTKVGAAGGGYVTSQVIRLQAQLPYEVVQYATGKEVLDALGRGEVDAAVFVGAAPLPNITQLDHTFKLLPMPGAVVDRLKAVYHASTITYLNIQAESVNTVAADCLLVAKEYKTPKFRKALAEFRAAFFENLDQLKETPGNHPKWQEVTAENHGKWPWMELSTDAKTTP